ncbi:hypothetical protein GALMADRAFT_149254 [Galerina marginata CBS 339.88]|uniref:Uncharacterized protein n=1 Tax=Galerina marginata (strain CBS 339.88) TaxID=685588 RepID=A0A067S1Y5_GALM3|nr:hypothetical protein GALMADRAFT_149254 [Galerina marginata CBS 339.88]
MDRVRGFPFLESATEVEEFVKWCEGSTFKCLRDWMADKKGSPWFIPSVNRFMSKIPRDDWFLSPGHTNLNESAHPFTNAHTGINLPISQAIKTIQTFELDSSIEEKIKNIGETCVLLNDHNTQLERDRANRKRQNARARARTQRMETDEKIQVVQDEIQQLTQVNKDVATRKKELQEMKKNLQESAGLKRSPQKKTGSRGKARLPDIEDIQDTENNISVAQATNNSLATAATATSNPRQFVSHFGNEVVNVPPIASGSRDTFFASYPATQILNISTQDLRQPSPGLSLSMSYSDQRSLPPPTMSLPPRGFSSPISYRDQYFLPQPSVSPPRRKNSITLSAELDPSHLMKRPYDPELDFRPYM